MLKSTKFLNFNIVASTGYRLVHGLLVLAAEERRRMAPFKNDQDIDQMDCLVPNAVAFGRTGLACAIVNL